MEELNKYENTNKSIHNTEKTKEVIEIDQFKNEDVETKEEKRLTLSEIEEYLQKDITPPGVKEYNDLPPEYKQEPSKSNVNKPKKVFN